LESKNLDDHEEDVLRTRDLEQRRGGIEGWIYPSFGAPDTPGTYPVTDVEADYAQYGICIMLETPTGIFMPMPDSGSITIEQIAMGETSIGTAFVGNFDLQLQQVEIDWATFDTTPVGGGCSGAATHRWNSQIQVDLLGDSDESGEADGFSDGE
jgi:hypothetical protein